jgi:hypothetical protein
VTQNDRLRKAAEWADFLELPAHLELGEGSQPRVAIAQLLRDFATDPGVSQPPPQITGYRSFAAEEVALINEIKAHAEATRELVERVKNFCLPLNEGSSAILLTPDPRWLAEARTDLQKGYMCLVRSVAKPETF